MIQFQNQRAYGLGRVVAGIRRMVFGAPSSVTPEAHMSWMAENMRAYAAPQFYVSAGGVENFTGETTEQRRAYKTMLKEPAIFSALIAKTVAVCSQEVSVVPEDEDDPTHRAAAGFVAWNGAHHVSGRWPKLLWNCAMGGQIDGFGVVEKVFDRVDRSHSKYPNYWALKAAKWKSADPIRFRLDEYKNVTGLYSVSAGQTGLPLDPKDFIIYTHLPFYESPFGLSIMRPVFRAATLIEAAIKLRSILLENFSGPFLVGKSSKANKAAFQRKLSEARALGYITIPDDAEVDVLNLATSAPDQFQQTIEDLRKEIYLAIRGAYLQALESSTPQGDSDTHRGQTQLFEWWLASTIATTLTEQLVPDLVRPNYGDRGGNPSVALGSSTQAAIAARLANLDTVRTKFGVALSKNQVRRVASAESPSGPEDEIPPADLNPQQPGVQAAGGGFPGFPQQFAHAGPDGFAHFRNEFADRSGLVLVEVPTQGGGKVHRWVKRDDAAAAAKGDGGPPALPAHGGQGGGGAADNAKERAGHLERVKRIGAKLGEWKNKAMATRVGRAIHHVEHALFIVAKKSQQVAVEAARQRGATPEQADRLAGVLGTADFLGGFVTGGLVGLTGSLTAAKVASYLPSASAAYLIYSAGRNPILTWSAAVKVAKQTVGLEKGPPAAKHADAEGFAAAAADRLLGYSPEEEDWRHALLVACLAHAGGDKAGALDLFDRAIQTPMPAELPEPDAADFGPDEAEPQPAPSVSFAHGGQDGFARAFAELGGESFRGWSALVQRFAQWKPYTRPSDKRQGFISEGGLVRFTKPKGEEREGAIHTKGRQKADPARRQAKHEERTAADTAAAAAINDPTRIHAGAVERLADDLAKLPKERLKDLARQLRAKVGGRKAELADRLLAHVRSVRDAEKPGEPPKHPEKGRVYMVNTGELHVDPKRFQFKLNTDASGVTKELKGTKTFNPDLAGVISVWKDPADGRTYVVNGHHRHELADRTGHPTLAVRYVDAPDHVEARGVGALINIAEGRGTAIDAAKFLRDTGSTAGDLADVGVSLTGKLASDAVALATLSPRTFDRLAGGLIEPSTALAVAHNLPDPELQDKLFKLIDSREEDGKPLADRTVAEMSREMRDTPKATTTTTGTLFGDIEEEESLFVPRNELKAIIRTDLAKELTDFSVLGSQRRADRTAGAGNVLNVAENQRIAEEAEQAKNLFDQLVNRTGPISDALNAGAAEYHKAKGKAAKTAAAKRVTEAVRAVIAAQLGRTAPADSTAVTQG